MVGYLIMCGIVGYIGKNKDASLGLEALKRLEYRGYDSSGLAFFVPEKNDIFCVKAVGRITQLEEKFHSSEIKEGSPVVAHCLHPDTLVQLADGSIKEISALSDQEMFWSFNKKTLTLEKKWGRVFRHKSPPYLYRIETPAGFIECSPEHGLIVYEGGKFIEKKAKNIATGDLLVFVKNISVEGEPMSFRDIFVKRYYTVSSNLHKQLVQKLYTTAGYRAKLYERGVSDGYWGHILRNDRNIREDVLGRVYEILEQQIPIHQLIPVNTIHGKYITLPGLSSPELMQFLGYLLGDGTVRERTIRFKDPDYVVIKTYQQFIFKLFSIKGRVVWLPKWNVYLLEANSQYLCNWLRINILERKYEFLSEIGKLSPEEVAMFLRGLFDAEGGVGIASGQVYIGMTDQRLIRIMQLLLQRFGITASYIAEDKKVKNWKEAHRLSLSNYENVNNFSRHIGFTSRRKQQRLHLLLSKLKPGLGISSKLIPMSKKEIWNDFFSGTSLDIQIFKKFISPVGRTSGKFLSAAKTEKLVESLEKTYLRGPSRRDAARVISFLKKFLYGQVVFQEIKNIQKVKTKVPYLYDIEVDGNHTFVANGFISHNSRWATHGQPSEVNAHPHHDCRQNIFLVHNGIIENFKSLRSNLEKEGHKFYSETDTETLCHLMEKFFTGNLEEAARQALGFVEGTYALAIIAKEDPGKMVLARKSSPLLLGLGDEEFFAASDPSAVVAHTKKVIYLEDGEMAVVTPGDFKISTLDRQPVQRPYLELDWDWEEASKGGYPHYMLKEIHEAPEVLENTLRGRLIEQEGLAKLGGLEDVAEHLKNIKRLIISASGSSYYSSLVGEYMLEEYAGLPVEVEHSAELRYRKPVIDQDTILLTVSQSGETADALATLAEFKRKNVLTLGMVNVVGSSIARETDAGVYNHAGPEIGVASTKVFLSQLTIFALLTLFLGRPRQLSQVVGQRIAAELKSLPAKAREVLGSADKLKKIAEKYQNFSNFLYIGRKYNFPIALEGALKLKEISYVHAEGYGAGEMKHGPIALIDENFPTVALAPSDSVYEKVVSNIMEIKARNGKVIAVATQGNEEIKKIVDDVIYIPKTLEMLTPILSVIPLQLFAYYIGVFRNCDVDKPRNLAKSVTVE